MNLSFEVALAARYTSSTQKIRILSEHLVGREAYCPGCGSCPISRHANNNPAADFFCPNCGEDYELKSQRNRFGSTVVDGAFGAMMNRLRAVQNPNLLLLTYEAPTLEVSNLVVVPKQFLTPDIIQKRRKPLSALAKRAGWTGCNILLQKIPDVGRIYLVKDRTVEPAATVIATWQRTLFLRMQGDFVTRSWLINVMRCIERIGQCTFSLDQVYAFEGELRELYPNNRHVREKIRQQLHLLRDNGYLDFLGRGKYRLAG
ncbi:MAG TPA: DpnI domain-containing protein [Steroidobacteraceae bacterium]